MELQLTAAATSPEQNQAWLPQARAVARRCAAALQGRMEGEQLASGCDFGQAGKAAKEACQADPRGYACQWARLADLGPQLPQLTRMERAFGVYLDESKSQGNASCPALTAPANFTAAAVERSRP